MCFTQKNKRDIINNEPQDKNEHTKMSLREIYKEEFERDKQHGYGTKNQKMR